MSTQSVLKRHTFSEDARRAWSDLRPALFTPELRALAILAALIFFSIIAIDVVAGLLKYKQLVAPETAHYLRISEQRSLGEYVGYMAMEMAVCFVFLTGASLQSLLHILLAALMQYLMLDDMFMLHESMGAKLASHYITTPTLFPAQALGELAYGAMLCVVLAGLFVSAARASTPYLRTLWALLMAPVLLLSFCAVGMDFLHAQVPRDAKYLDGIVALVEDGGELFSTLALMLIGAAQWIALPWLSEPDDAAQNPP